LPTNFQAALFSDQEVQRALSITPDQIARLGDVDVVLRRRLQSALRDMDRLSEPARAVKSDELLLKYNSDLMHETAKVLDARQMERYRQLSRSSEGLLVFTDPDVVKGLGLTEKEQERLQSLRERLDKQLNDLMKKPKRDVAATQQKAATLRREAMQQVGSILQPRQKEVFTRLTSYRFPAEAKATQPAGNSRGTGGPAGR
jgi:hypothetical protein